MASSPPKPPPDAPAPSPSDPKRQSDEPDADHSDDSDTLGPRIATLFALLREASLLHDGDAAHELLTTRMERRPLLRPRTIH